MWVLQLQSHPEVPGVTVVAVRGAGRAVGSPGSCHTWVLH